MGNVRPAMYFLIKQMKLRFLHKHIKTWSKNKFHYKIVVIKRAFQNN